MTKAVLKDDYSDSGMIGWGEKNLKMRVQRREAATITLLCNDDSLDGRSDGGVRVGTGEKEWILLKKFKGKHL